MSHQVIHLRTSSSGLEVYQDLLLTHFHSDYRAPPSIHVFFMMLPTLTSLVYHQYFSPVPSTTTISPRTVTHNHKPQFRWNLANREAKTQIKLLDQLLKVKEPWDREVDVVRNRSVSGGAGREG